MQGRSALFRLSQRLPRDIRKYVCNMARIKLHQRTINPFDPKLMGLVTEIKSMEFIPHCFVCGNPYLHYGFVDYLYGEPEKSWTDIECSKCKKFIVEVKSTKVFNPRKVYGGSYKMYERMSIKPLLLVFSNLQIDDRLHYHHDLPRLFKPKGYHVRRKSCGKSIITLNKDHFIIVNR